MYTIALLVEQPLTDADVKQVVGLHSDGEPESFVVLVRGEADQHRLLSALDELALGHVARAAEEVVEDPAEHGGVEYAREVLRRSVTALRGAGVEATGEVTPGDPVGVLREACERYGVDEVIVLTRPHLVSEFLHRDWATRARKLTDLPVLRLFAHSG